MTITSTPPEVRPAHRVLRAGLLFLLVLPGLLWAGVRLFGLPGGYLLAFTPYAAAWAWIPVLAALAARKWLVAAVAVMAAAVLSVGVLPRALPDAAHGPAGGTPLTVMTINLFRGAADPAAVTRLVREHDVAVLAVQELTPAARDALAAAGLDTLLPHRTLAAEPGATGSGLYSRFPVTATGAERGPGGNLEAYATVQPPGAGPVGVESAHWGRRADPAGEPGGVPRILLGDFNATLDHAPLRDLVAGGYRDAADAVGDGLEPTLGPVTLDHVLVDRRIGVTDVDVRPVPRSDHRSIIAVLALPAT
ncbi:endonuclease/exonuclease/phosphatase family protein [Paractinoplanes rishiriensis]|uniref:Endonuclease n=1 Tax=Paractinoplanes rishiriensis TaxID=1050105 RepID=A0A919JS34_9ACTN|nr:endonuclease/exonuclease/phosphatase family protein [Actinoplanes rishiriensis]GIE93733.1 endonuclease [Actinoplanes rishiriensis]